MSTKFDGNDGNKNLERFNLFEAAFQSFNFWLSTTDIGFNIFLQWLDFMLALVYFFPQISYCCLQLLLFLLQFLMIKAYSFIKLIFHGFSKTWKWLSNTKTWKESTDEFANWHKMMPGFRFLLAANAFSTVDAFYPQKCYKLLLIGMLSVRQNFNRNDQTYNECRVTISFN